MVKLTEFLRNKQVLWTAIVFCLFVQVADTISSLGFDLHFQETNPFVRDALHQFNLHKGIVVKLIAFGTFGLLSAAIYRAFKRHSTELQDFLSSLPFWYWAVITIETVVTNVLLKMGYYVE